MWHRQHSTEHFILSLQSRFRNLYLSRSTSLPVLFGRFTRGETLLILIAACIGLASGVVIIGFNWAVEFAGDQFDRLFTLSYGMNWWQYLLIPLIPALGGLVVGILQTHMFRSEPGHGVPEVILASRFSRGTVHSKVILQKLLTASLSIASGGGGGREGPIVHVGAAVGNSIARLFRLTSDQSRTLIACGAAAGISGIFNAPIGGVMFVLEVILGDFRLKTFTPVVVASVAATAFTRNFYGDNTLVFAPAGFSLQPAEYPFFVLLGILLGIAAAGFTRIIMGVETWFVRVLRERPTLRPAFGGLMAGCFIMFLPELMEQSYEPINMALHARLPLWLLVMVAVVKPLHAAVTIGSGGTGGVFAPALKSGAMLGAAFGMGVMALVPSLNASPTAYALCGMGALLAGTMHAPLTAVLMVIEISDGYAIVLPAMLTAILAALVAQRFVKPSIYTWALASGDRRLGSYAYLPALHSMSIEKLIDRSVEIVCPDIPLRTILGILERSQQDAILVANTRGEYLGMIEFDDVREFLTEATALDTLVALDLMVTSVQPVGEKTTLDIVLKLFDNYGWKVLPVVANENGNIPVGLLTVHDAQRYYRKSVTREH